MLRAPNEHACAGRPSLWLCGVAGLCHDLFRQVVDEGVQGAWGDIQPWDRQEALKRGAYPRRAGCGVVGVLTGLNVLVELTYPGDGLGYLQCLAESQAAAEAAQADGGDGRDGALVVPVGVGGGVPRGALPGLAFPVGEEGGEAAQAGVGDPGGCPPTPYP